VFPYSAPARGFNNLSRLYRPAVNAIAVERGQLAQERPDVPSAPARSLTVGHPERNIEICIADYNLEVPSL
jgi:hypothetical protein